MEEIQNPLTTRHRFDQPMQCLLTYREHVELEYASQFIPYLVSSFRPLRTCCLMFAYAPLPS